MTSKWLLLAVLAVTVPLLPVPAHASTPTCSFILGFATLKALIDEAEGPDKVGDCLEDQRFNPENGDALQQTTGGLMVWRKLDNWTAFTDGYRTWINGPYGLQSRLNTENFDWEAVSPASTPTQEYGMWEGEWISAHSRLDDNIYWVLRIQDADSQGFTYSFECRSVPYGPNVQWSNQARASFRGPFNAANPESGEVFSLDINPADRHDRVIEIEGLGIRCSHTDALDNVFIF